MFKKVFSRLFGSKKSSPPRVAPAAQPAAAPAQGQPAVAAAPASAIPAARGAAPVPAPAREEKKPAALANWEKEAARAVDPKAGADEICGITAAMTREEIHERLAMLYRRHNRAASSLDPKLRDEAEVMLEAIATLREKHFGRTGKA